MSAAAVAVAVVPKCASSRWELGPSSLPDDIAHNIASLLDASDMCSLGSCSRFWRDVCASDALWIALSRKRWPPSDSVSDRSGSSHTQCVLGVQEAFDRGGGGGVLHLCDAVAPWHVWCLSKPPETLVSFGEWEGPDYSPSEGLSVTTSAPVSASTDLIVSIWAIEADASLTDQEKAKRRQELVSGSTTAATEEELIKKKGKVASGDALDLLNEKFNCSFCMQIPERPIIGWKHFYISEHKKMSYCASSVVKFVEQCSQNGSLEGGNYLKAMGDLCLTKFGFKDVLLFLLARKHGLLLNLIGLHYSILWLRIPASNVMEALHSCQVSERQVLVSWSKFGRWVYGFRMPDEYQSRQVSLGELAMANEDELPALEVLSVLSRGAIHEVLRVQISSATTSAAQPYQIPVSES